MRFELLSWTRRIVERGNKPMVTMFNDRHAVSQWYNCGFTLNLRCDLPKSGYNDSVV